MDTTPTNRPYRSVLDMIGNTPMVEVTHIDTGKARLFLKLENQNPGGSIKDRIALSMIEAAERSGKIKPGDTLVEATAGNTGLGLALVARQKGYKILLVIPDKMSAEKIFHLKALGAEVLIARSDVTKGHPDYYQDRARRIANSRKDAFYINQFENPANPAAHEQGTAPEIWDQMDHMLDAVVCGVGSGGTLSGLGRFFARVAPHVEMVLADPVGSVLAPLVNTGEKVEAKGWLVEGIGEDYVPENCDLDSVGTAYSIPDEESITTARLLLESEGVLCGSSSGALVAAALRYCRAQTEEKRVVTLICDSGNKYLSKIYNPYWLNDQGMTQRPLTHDLRDLIARPFARDEVVWSAPHETLHQVHAKMQMHDISQIPIVNEDKLVGLIDEMELLLFVTGNEAGFAVQVGKVMSRKTQTIDVQAPMTDLLPIFERCSSACVMDAEQFLGLITPIDFINYLRKRTGRS